MAESSSSSSDEAEKETSPTDEEETQSGTLNARPYQVDMLNKALERNTIVCLGTGTGKTFISVMLIRELAHQVRNEFRIRKNGKRTFFIVHTVPLVSQQAKVLENETNLKIGKYIGEMGVDFWDKERWLGELKKSNVLVMTAQIFLNLLTSGVLGLSDLNLLIFDECHHAKKNDPFKQIMEFFDCCPREDYPRVMGLTASVINGKVKPARIEMEIKQLEATLRSTCETSQDKEVEKYATKPNELVQRYSMEILDEMVLILINLLHGELEQGLAFLDDCRVAEGVMKEAVWLAKYALRECDDILYSLGPQAAYQVAGYLIHDLDRGQLFLQGSQQRRFLRFSVTQLRKLRGLYENFMESNGMDIGVIDSRLISPKFQTLLEILRHSRNSQALEEATVNQLCGIVFVEKRYTALILKDQINKIAEQDQSLSFIKCDYVIGHGTGGHATYSSQTEMNFKKQERVLSKFRRHEFNLLIATSVVEEGLDVPRCNFVVRFDFPKNFGSYVQSKGRARAKDSKYYMLVDEQEFKEKQGELEMLRAIERVLSEICHNREPPTEEECMEAISDSYLPPYKPVEGEGKARVTMNSSIGLLCRYCSKLPGDRFTHLTPDFVIEEYGELAFVCTVQMPINCPLRQKIVGQVMPRKKLAKMAAAYEACKRLHEIGELDDDLKPVRILCADDSDDDEQEDDEESAKKGKQGTKKRKRFYERKVPDVFVGGLPQEGQPMWLYTITMKLAESTCHTELGPMGRCFSNRCCQMFGLLIRNQLPPVRPFKIYPDFGEVTVSLDGPKSLTSYDLRIVRLFHQYLFGELLRMPLEISQGDQSGFYIVLLHGDRIDTTTALQVEERVGSFQDPQTVVIEDPILLQDAAVIPRHREVGGRKETVIVTKVCRYLSPRSVFPEPSKAKTFEKYFLQEYGCRVKKLDQPLLEVVHTSLRVNHLVDRQKKKASLKRRRDRPIHLIPELCDLHPLPASILSAALLVPSILHRMTSLLLVLQLREKIAEGMGIQEYVVTAEDSLPPIGAERKTQNLPSRRYEIEDPFGKLDELFSNDATAAVPDSAVLLQALTTARATDIFDLERLEMLGDAFLKLAVSVHLFVTFEDKDEGRLTKRKIKQISNLALFKAATERDFPCYIQDTQFTRGMWCPPGFRPSQSYNGGTAEVADEPNEDMLESESGGAMSPADRAMLKCSRQRISDKCVADSVEALIGAYLIWCGYRRALDFLKYLGLQVLPEELGKNVHGQQSADLEEWEDGSDDDSGSCSSGSDLPERVQSHSPGKYAIFPMAPLKAFETGDDGSLGKLTSGFDQFQRRIKYEFKNQLYLLQALTHASYQPNRLTDCYQRLEFLGDALLDFLVTQYVYFRNTQLSPGELTDLRQALVNNNIFARIAVEYEFHKYLNYMSPGWFSKIDKFVCALEMEDTGDEKENEGKQVSSDSFITVTEAEEEGIEAPKVLGDIFESVAGAVFLDSGMDLKETWRVCYRMMAPYIEKYSKNVPRNPIRLVHESDAKADFGKVEPLKDGRVKCKLRVSWGEFEGYGVNGKIAKLTAAKIAMEDKKRKHDG